VDYYGEQEAIELGPDENMHDSMVELIARQAVKRKYILGSGIISSKRIGINHRQYGVTSLGVYTFARIAMSELGIDMEKDAFSVKMTGGPAGDVAGNTLRLLLENCPKACISLIVDGSGVLCDPRGLDRRELRRLVLSRDVESFDPDRLGEGGFMLLRRMTRTRGMREMFLRIQREKKRPVETWVMADEMHREFRDVVFREKADLFIPAGGRPETVHGENWEAFLDDGAVPSCRVIVEGANSFLSAEARERLQEKGIVIIRDASANKCGVIASSYEIIANLLMNDREFLRIKERYVRDVMKILEKRAAHEAHLIFRRRHGGEENLLFTSISDNLSREINDFYDRIFSLLTEKPDLLRRRAHRRALFAHLPAVVCKNDRLRRRVANLPLKYRCAMVACEVAGRIVYLGGWKKDFQESLNDFIRASF
jgi:glutamate dehydrogenase